MSCCHYYAYSVAGMVRDFRPAGYPDDAPICPHGMSVIVNAPAAFRFTASACPERHLEGAGLLGANVHNLTKEDAGEVLVQKLLALMKATGMPNGVGGVGYEEADIPDLAAGAYLQQRLLKNAPRPVNKQSLVNIYRDALSYW